MKKEILDGLNVTNIEINGEIVEPLDMAEQNMFASREDISSAFEYAKQVIDRSVTPESAIHGMTAIAVIWNTLATKYHLIPKQNGDTRE